MSKISRENKKKNQKYATVNQAKVNSITNSAVSENQNTHHNIKKESLGPNTLR